MLKKFIAELIILSVLFLPSISGAAPPIPARIGGTITVNGTQLTQADDTGYTIKVTKSDGSAFTPAAEDTDGLNSSDWYLIDIPIYHETDQPGGANPEDTVIIHVYLDGTELSVTTPANGQITVESSGSTSNINIVASSLSNSSKPIVSVFTVILLD